MSIKDRIEEKLRGVGGIESIYCQIVCLEREGPLPSCERRENIQHIRDQMERFNITSKIIPGINLKRNPELEKKLWKKLPSYIQYLKGSCGVRHSNYHFVGTGALAIMHVMNKKVWNVKHWPRHSGHSIVFEENSTLISGDRLIQILKVSLEKNADFVQIHTHANGLTIVEFFLNDTCKKQPLAKVIHTFPFGTLDEHNRPEASGKCYLISRRFAKHMRRVCRNGYPGIHYDYLLGLEASYPTDSNEKFIAFRFTDSSSLKRSVVSQIHVQKGYERIKHDPPVCFRSIFM